MIDPDRTNGWSPMTNLISFSSVPTRGCRLRALDIDDGGVGTGDEEVLVTRVTPADDVGRLSVRVADLQHLATPIGLAHPTPTDDDVVPNSCLHRGSLRLLDYLHRHPIFSHAQGRDR